MFSESNLSHEEKVDKEMKRYEEYSPVVAEFNPLTWWRDEQKKFSIINS